ncbi:hypothetical protein NUM3379_41620 [Kineococcus sp. NUM-3379]
MSTRVAAPPRRSWNLPASTYETVFTHVYAGLGVNVLLLVATSPLLVPLVSVADPVRSWPFFLVLSACTAPAVAAAFGCFAVLRAEGELRPVRDFCRCWRRTARRSLAVWAVGAAAVAVLGADVAFVSGTPAGPVLVPLLLVLTALAVVASLTALAGVVAVPAARTGALLRAGVFLAVRHWLAGVLALVLLAALATAVTARPLLAGVLLPSAVLFVLWSNAHVAITRAVAAPPAP